MACPFHGRSRFRCPSRSRCLTRSRCPSRCRCPSRSRCRCQSRCRCRLEAQGEEAAREEAVAGQASPAVLEEEEEEEEEAQADRPDPFRRLRCPYPCRCRRTRKNPSRRSPPSRSRSRLTPSCRQSRNRCRSRSRYPDPKIPSPMFRPTRCRPSLAHPSRCHLSRRPSRWFPSLGSRIQRWKRGRKSSSPRTLRRPPARQRIRYPEPSPLVERPPNRARDRRPWKRSRSDRASPPFQPRPFPKPARARLQPCGSRWPHLHWTPLRSRARLCPRRRSRRAQAGSSERWSPRLSSRSVWAPKPRRTRGTARRHAARAPGTEPRGHRASAAAPARRRAARGRATASERRRPSRKRPLGGVSRLLELRSWKGKYAAVHVTAWSRASSGHPPKRGHSGGSGYPAVSLRR
jgi:hypothetical protein